MSKIKIGWAEETLVPEGLKVNLRGQFFERISEYVESEITATAMAVESDGEQMIIVSSDMTSIEDFLLNMIREKFAKICTGFDPKKIIVAATHTHTSHTCAKPGANSGFSKARQILDEFLPEGKAYQTLVTADDSVMKPEDASVFVSSQIALAAKKAWENRTEALYANEFGRAAVGMCRRASYTDGSAQMWGDTDTAAFDALEGGNDSGIELIYTFDTNKKLTGVVANIACPAQILEQRSFISADFWGRAKANIREKLGKDVYLLGLCGAAGDQCPRDLVRWVNPETPIDDPNVKRPYPKTRKADPSMYDISGCNRVGKRIANEIVSVYEEIEEYKDSAKLVHMVLDLDLPLRKATISDYNNAVRELEYYVNKNKDKEHFDFEDNAKMHVHTGTIARFREQQFSEIFTVETHIIRFGDVAFSTNPFELFLDFGNRIKARSNSKQTFIVQLCGGSAGYLPTEKAEKAGHYSAYISSGYVGHEGGDLFVRKTVSEINKMFE
ncbi:MAG: hypothetical protein IJW06_00710 [Clostridia bacterium]|nr:hypothetical protein [Clostridia bacterium]